MNITSHEEYGLRCALQLARSFGNGPLSASKVAEREGISVEYVSKFMHLFRKAGVVKSIRGTQGGFELCRPPKEIVLKEILSVLGGRDSTRQHFCQHYSGLKEVCVNICSCSIRPLWSVITYYFESIFNHLSLKDLMGSEEDVMQTVQDLFSQKMAMSDAKSGSFQDLRAEGMV